MIIDCVGREHDFREVDTTAYDDLAQGRRTDIRICDRCGAVDSAPKTAQGHTREIPLAFNGYCTVAQAAIVVPASDVQSGDVLITDRYVSLVRAVCTYHLAPNWPVLHIAGDVNVVRFPHELVSVIRPATS